MKLGTAKLDISPKFSVTMGGYGDRKGKSIGVLDPIYAHALVFKDYFGKSAVIITADLIGLNQLQVAQIKYRIYKLTNIDQACIVVSTTHTHSGPLTYDNPVMGKADQNYVNWLMNEIPNTVVDALENMQSCKLGWYQGEFRGVGDSRRASKREVKTMLTVLAAVDSKENLIGILFNYNCHPTVLSAENLMISADYPGAAMKFLEEKYGDEVLCTFTNGACGDVSTRFTRNSQDYSEATRLGELLASEVIKAIDKITYEEVPNLSIKEKSFNLIPRSLPDEDKLNEDIKK